MKEPTLEEINKLVTFTRDRHGTLCIKDVNGTIFGSVIGSVERIQGYVTYIDGDIIGQISGNIFGEIHGDIEGDVKGQIYGNVTCVHGDIKFIKNPNL
jgi:hypothetical protein